MSDGQQESMLSRCRKLRLENPTLWSHHFGGWTHTVGLIKQNLCCDDGLLFITSAEDLATEEAKVISEPWVGMVHQVPKNNYEWFPDLKRMVVDTTFRQSLMQCKGLFCLSSVVSDFLREHLPDVPVTRLLYPYTPTNSRFNKVDFFSRKNTTRVLFVGEYMRNFQYFFDLDLPPGFQKILLQSPDVNMKTNGIVTNDSVTIRQYVGNDEYDALLCNSVVFLNLFDAAANTTVLECIIRNTPIVVNRLPGLEEYLGRDYPLFYDTAIEARELLTSDQALQKGSEYLENLPLKTSLNDNSFLHALQNSATYRLLPVPASQKAISQRIPEYDITVMICSYKRVYNMENLLQCFVNQTIDKNVEIIVWNNNYSARDELQLICDGFKGKLDIKVIHSTEKLLLHREVGCDKSYAQ
ncbi:uncharacterized protein LOC135471691 [Liolophura sinensis]|uniref:uncharacterized protein LOC135471691 n=1 Tax=Liolophura sinensis TaxID=3198878 RepID=UPI0031589DF0